MSPDRPGLIKGRRRHRLEPQSLPRLMDWFMADCSSDQLSRDCTLWWSKDAFSPLTVTENHISHSFISCVLLPLYLSWVSRLFPFLFCIYLLHSVSSWLNFRRHAPDIPSFCLSLPLFCFLHTFLLIHLLIFTFRLSLIPSFYFFVHFFLFMSPPLFPSMCPSFSPCRLTSRLC
jgi:hypothetical protein